MKTIERLPAYSCYEDTVKAIHDDLTDSILTGDADKRLYFQALRNRVI